MEKGATALEYDGLILDTGDLDAYGLTPMSALPLLVEALRTGHPDAFWEEGGCDAVELLFDDHTRARVWFDEEGSSLPGGAHQRRRCDRRLRNRKLELSMNDLQKRTWAEISLPNIRHNYEAIRAALPEGCRFLGVVKADAYGHGALPVSRLLQEAGADYLAVSCLDEALELRRGGITMPILILGHTPPEYTSLLIEENLTQTVSALAKAKEYSAAARAGQDAPGPHQAGHRHVPSGLSLRRGLF